MGARGVRGGGRSSPSHSPLMAPPQVSTVAPLIAAEDYPPGAWLYGDPATGTFIGGAPPLSMADGNTITAAR